MPSYLIRVLEDHRFQVYRTRTGIDREDVGEPFLTPYLACRFVDVKEGRPISPLRRRPEGA